MEQLSRRGFLSMFAGAASAAVLPTRRYFFAPLGGWRSEVIVNPKHVRIGQYADYFEYLATATFRIEESAIPTEVIFLSKAICDSIANDYGRLLKDVMKVPAPVPHARKFMLVPAGG